MNYLIDYYLCILAITWIGGLTFSYLEQEDKLVFQLDLDDGFQADSLCS